MAEEATSTAETPSQEPAKEATPKKKLSGKSLAAVIVGGLLVLMGMFSFSNNTALNNALVSVGAGQSMLNLCIEYPEIKPTALKLADVIDAAIAARTTSPDQLVEIIGDVTKDFATPGLKDLVTLIVNHLNITYQTSKTEAEYIVKIQYFVRGLRDGVQSAEDIVARKAASESQ